MEQIYAANLLDKMIVKVFDCWNYLSDLICYDDLQEE